MAYDGLNAVEKVKSSSKKGVFYKLILMDFEIQGLTGLKASLKIKNFINELVKT